MGYELIYEGPVDDSADTLRKLKTTLLTKFQLDVQAIRAILEQYPVTVRSAKTEQDLQPYLQALQSAGGKARLQPDLKTEPAGPRPPPEESEDEEEFSIQFDFSEDLDEEPEVTKPQKRKEQQKVYKLDDSTADVAAPGQAASNPPSQLNAEVESLVSTLAVSKQVSKSDHPSFDDIVRPLLPPEKGHAARSSVAPKPVQSETSSEKSSAKTSGLTKPLSNQAEREEALPTELDPASAVEQPPACVLAPQLQAAVIEQPWRLHFLLRLKVFVRRRRQLLRDLGLTLLISTLVLAGGLWYAHIQFQARQAALAKLVASIQDTPIEDSAPAAATAEVIRKANYFCRKENKEFAIEGYFEVSEQILKNISLELTTPPPPELTADEVVERKTKPLWLEKVTISDCNISQKPNASFLAECTAKAFLEVNRVKSRLSGNAAVTGSLDNNNGVLTLRVLANKGYAEILKTNFRQEGKSAKDFKFFFADNLTAKLVPHNQALPSKKVGREGDF